MQSLPDVKEIKAYITALTNWLRLLQDHHNKEHHESDPDPLPEPPDPPWGP